jgi:hypothetical protein
VTAADIGAEEFQRLIAAVGAKLAELTGMPLEQAEHLAGSVCGCVLIVDDDGMLTFRDDDENPVVRLPFSAFAELLDDEEDDGEEPEEEP